MIRSFLIAFLIWTNTGTGVRAESMKLAVTTSFHNSGLSDVLLPEIKADTGIDVQLLVVGTGQALKLGRSGDVDAILVHSRTAEDAFVANGYGPHRTEIMYNDFVVIGPSDDPANVADSQTIKAAFMAIEQAKAVFISRGDDSGTHKKERALWADSGLNDQDFGRWYRRVGAGMGAALNTASGMQAYVLADRASWLNFANKGDLALLFARDPALFNQYAFIPVTSEGRPHIKADLAKQLEAWLLSTRAKSLINNYKINGEVLFTFNGKAP